MEDKEVIDDCTIDISVIVCCYNPNFDLLKSTINSIVNQINTTYEIIISDDGSKENYTSMIDDYMKKIGFCRYQLNFLKRNQGTVKNIYSALKIARGRFIKVISPGDYLYNRESLSVYVRYLNNENADIVFSKAVYYKDRQILKKINPRYYPIYKNKNLKRNIILFNDYVLGATIALKKDIALVYFQRISEFSILLEDMPLIFLGLMDDKRIMPIPEVLIWYEYGFGVSTGNAKSILEKDYEKCYKQMILEYDNRMIKKSFKLYKLQFYPLFVRYFIKFFYSYDYFFHSFIMKHFSKIDCSNISINDKDQITNIY